MKRENTNENEMTDSVNDNIDYSIFSW